VRKQRYRVPDTSPGRTWHRRSTAAPSSRRDLPCQVSRLWSDTYSLKYPTRTTQTALPGTRARRDLALLPTRQPCWPVGPRPSRPAPPGTRRSLHRPAPRRPSRTTRHPPVLAPTPARAFCATRYRSLLRFAPGPS